MNNSLEACREAIYLALSTVPAGRVVTYGQLAALAGLPRSARLAGRALRLLPPDTRLPWHRVVNASGRISIPADSPGFSEQIRRLTGEGVEMNNQKINLRVYGYNP